MRSARPARLLALAVAIAAAGCSTVSQPLGAIRDAMTPASSGSTASAEAPAPRAPVFKTPVNPAAQRAFDDASSLLRSGRIEEAQRAFRAVAQAYPDLAGPHANLGVIDRRAGKLAEATSEFEQAIRLSPAQPVYYNELGVTYRQRGEFAKARDAYQKALALDPRYPAPTLNLGILYDLYLGDPARALQQYSQFLALSPNGDATVTKWVADLKNRKPGPITVSRQEKQ